MKQDTIVTLVMANGAEIIGKYITDDMVTYTLERPRLVQVTEKGVGLVDGIAMTGSKPDGTVQFNKHSVAYLVETAKEIANGWMTQTSGIQMPQKGGIIS